jgi:hypothetical protein
MLADGRSASRPCFASAPPARAGLRLGEGPPAIPCDFHDSRDIHDSRAIRPVSVPARPPSLRLPGAPRGSCSKLKAAVSFASFVNFRAGRAACLRHASTSSSYCPACRFSAPLWPGGGGATWARREPIGAPDTPLRPLFAGSRRSGLAALINKPLWSCDSAG